MGRIIPFKPEFWREPPAYRVNWSKEFNRHRPATPRPPCDECHDHESAGVCACGTPLCHDCADYHLESHEQ